MGFRFFSTLLNLITLISVILLCAMVTEWLFAGFERMQRDVFKLIFCVVAVLFTIKYYYGPDISTYVPLYENICGLDRVVAKSRSTGFEVGYLAFCSICRAAGLSFWGMSVVVSVLIFSALYLLIRRLRYGQVMALALIVIMNPDLLYAQFRQCLAVAFFIFAVLLADNRKYLLALILAFVAMTMHKSAMFMIAPAILYYAIQPMRMEMSSLGTMLLVLCLLVLIPTQELIEHVVDSMHIGGSAMKSLKMHISFTNLYQSNLFIFGAALVSLMTFSHGKRGRTAILVAAMMALMVTVVFYQYYMMAARLRAYFMPFAVVTIIAAGIEAKEENLPWSTLVRQTSKIVVLGFLVYKTVAMNVNSAKDGDVLDICTVFDLSDHSEKELRDRQMAKAQKFWDENFLKGDDLAYRSKNYVDQYKDDPVFSKNRNKTPQEIKNQMRNKRKKNKRYEKFSTIK